MANLPIMKLRRRGADMQKYLVWFIGFLSFFALTLAGCGGAGNGGTDGDSVQTPVLTPARNLIGTWETNYPVTVNVARKPSQ